MTGESHKVPYYAQTADFSCGPACVLMALAALDGDTSRLTTREEFRIWRRTGLIGVPAADAFTLALPYLDKGYEVRILNELLPTFPHDRMVEYANEEAARLANFASLEAKEEVEAAGVPVEARAPAVRDVLDALADGWLPNCMVGMQEVHDEEVPHWVLALEADEESVWFHDPYSATGGPTLFRDHETFQKMIDDNGAMGFSRALVLVRR